MLLERRGEVVTREELHQRLWPTGTFVDFDHGLNNAINRLRDALSDPAEAPRYIETLPRRGYRFIAPIEEIDRAPAQGAFPTEPARLAGQPAARSMEKPAAEAGTLPELHPRRKQLWLGTAAVATAAILLFGLNVRGVRDRVLKTKHPAHIQSLAVLPLENLTGDPAQEYFVDGMTDALITDLAQIGSLKVISRTSAMQYKGVRKPLPQIAKELNVDAIVEGSVVRYENRVRIDAQLIQAATDQHLWAKSYERELRDVVTLQSEVARGVAKEIQIRLTPQERAQLAAAKPVNPEAYEDYLQGRFYHYKRTSDGIAKAIAYFQQAVGKDPNFALAYAGLADSYLISSQGPISPREAMPKAEAAARKALELDDSLGEAHASLAGFEVRYKWDWRGAEEELRRALALSPNNAEIYRQYAVFLRMANRYQEAIAAAQRAVALDPLSVDKRADLGAAYLIARQDDRAIQELREGAAMNPELQVPHWFLSIAYEYTGRSREALSESERAVALSHRDPLRLASLAHAYAHFGQPGEARKILAELMQRSKREYVGPYYIALVWIGLGNKQQAIAWLGKAYEDRSFALVTINSFPWWDPLRSDPQFQALVRRIGLDPDLAIPK